MSGSEPGATSAQRSVTIVNQKGLHARAAAKFVRLAQSFEVTLKVAAKGQTVSGHSLMGLMLLAAGPGTRLVIAAEGKDARAAVAALAKLVEDGFDEET
jgi:phosphocarrier protein HPr